MSGWSARLSDGPVWLVCLGGGAVWSGCLGGRAVVSVPGVCGPRGRGPEERVDGLGRPAELEGGGG